MTGLRYRGMRKMGATIPGSKCAYCDDEVVAKDLCWIHYERQRTGKPMTGPIMRLKDCDIPWCKVQCRLKYCQEHRRNYETWGNPLAEAPATPAAEKKFWKQAQVRSKDVCWPWEGRTFKKYNQKQAYGIIIWQGKRVTYAHQVAYLLGHGEKCPDGMVITWSCGNSLCVNPAHLRPATRSQALHGMAHEKS